MNFGVLAIVIGLMLLGVLLGVGLVGVLVARRKRPPTKPGD